MESDLNNPTKLKPICGIVMPISGNVDYPKEHWVDVLSIIEDVCESIKFESNLVSKSDEIGVIHKNIVQNLNTNDIVVCDVSSLNPNVMFELGLRLAFDKPTIIIKDEITKYQFDTSIIEHLEYPRDLRFHKITNFKKILAEKITATHKKASSDKNFSTFVKYFGIYKVAEIQQEQVSSMEFILRSIEELKSELVNMRMSDAVERAKAYEIARMKELSMERRTQEERENLRKMLQEVFKTGKEYFGKRSD